MTLVGKIFTVLILIMSLVFMSFAVAVFATHKNWKVEAKAKETKITEAQGLIDGLQNQINELKTALELERGARVSALAALESKNVHSIEQLEQKEKSLASLQSTHARAVDAMDATQTRLAGLVDEVGKLRDNVRDTQKARDELFATVVKLTDEAHDLKGKEEALNTMQSQLVGRVAKMKRVLKAHGITEDTPVSHIPPSLDGVVTAVSERGFVEVSLGSDDGLLKGHSMEIFRNNTYLGRVVVRKVEPDRAVAEIVPEFRKGIIKVGDRVATKVS